MSFVLHWGVCMKFYHDLTIATLPGLGLVASRHTSNMSLKQCHCCGLPEAPLASLCLLLQIFGLARLPDTCLSLHLDDVDAPMYIVHEVGSVIVLLFLYCLPGVRRILLTAIEGTCTLPLFRAQATYALVMISMTDIGQGI